MKKFLFMIAFFLYSFSFLLSANALVIDFENVPGAKELEHHNNIDKDYYGFNWNFFYVLHKNHPRYKRSGLAKGAVSGNWVAVAFDGGSPLATIDSDVFNFNGVYATSCQNSSTKLTIKGFLNDTQKYSFDYSINNQSPTWIDADFTGINKLTFNTSGEHFAMDDLTFNEASPTPEPSTLILFGLGILGMAGITRKKLTK